MVREHMLIKSWGGDEGKMAGKRIGENTCGGRVASGGGFKISPMVVVVVGVLNYAKLHNLPNT